jgi:hypothetical protein
LLSTSTISDLEISRVFLFCTPLLVGYMVVERCTGVFDALSVVFETVLPRCGAAEDTGYPKPATIYSKIVCRPLIEYDGPFGGSSCQWYQPSRPGHLAKLFRKTSIHVNMAIKARIMLSRVACKLFSQTWIALIQNAQHLRQRILTHAKMAQVDSKSSRTYLKRLDTRPLMI